MKIFYSLHFVLQLKSFWVNKHLGFLLVLESIPEGSRLQRSGNFHLKVPPIRMFYNQLWPLHSCLDLTSTASWMDQERQHILELAKQEIKAAVLGSFGVPLFPTESTT